MERHEEQEQEFWARLGEQGISRSQMLRRSLAAAAGLTVMGAAPGAASGARRLMRATPPTRGS